MNRYSLAAGAQIDLQDIRGYLSTAPQTIQLRILNELDAAFHRLCDFPLIGRAEPELTSRYGEHTRSILVEPYRIFYFPERIPLSIIAILHGARDIPTLMRERLG